MKMCETKHMTTDLNIDSNLSFNHSHLRSRRKIHLFGLASLGSPSQDKISLIGHWGAYHGTCLLFSSVTHQHWQVVVFPKSGPQMSPETPPEQQGVSRHHVLANKSFVWFYYVLKWKSLRFNKCHEFPLKFISSRTTCCLSSFPFYLRTIIWWLRIK